MADELRMCEQGTVQHKGKSQEEEGEKK